jgi:LacI family transcriptional regulator
MRHLNRPTIKDVAREANVSIATVSRILNKGVGYSDKTKQHVLETIEKMGYHPNAVARGLINKKTDSIGVLFPNVSGLISAQILQGIEEVAQSHGISVIVCNTASDHKKTMDYLTFLQEKQVDGLLFISQLLTKDYREFIKKMGVPIITISAFSETNDVPYVKVDDEAASYDAVRYLIEKGHTDIGMISGPPTDPLAGHPRIQGYKRALREADLPFIETKVTWHKGFYFEDGQVAFQKLLKSHLSITALFAASDELAISAVSSAYHLGIRVPHQLSVIGYDDTKLAKMSIPPLTTVSQPFEEMGAQATKKLIDSIQSREPNTSLTMPHRIAERESVKNRMAAPNGHV